ncbi:hypothetical protein KSC_084620 [Ktedonobacter sp. SOSP1-52]|uniref:hypothetical protein n=1 Tax=Ktedonobacter sp. SOSP1-52 TaxID=2778366 RepID=UPI001915DDA5|nr:hypothetical protein [Ktedonobacter sp. SOSP1-52]GHO69570.1 hypothetical protein KSC_084620 [Ktedonobacter sp. SOSP1-52]
MSKSIPNTSLEESQPSDFLVHISYECILQERAREFDSYIYEIACSIAYPATTGHLSLRITGANSYRRSNIKEVPVTYHEHGATTYVELFEDEQLEVRIITLDGIYSKAIYVARKQELCEQYARQLTSNLQKMKCS